MDRIEQSVIINAPIEDCYRVFRDFERYPEIANVVKQVRHKGNLNGWHWEVLGPQDKILAWDLDIHGMRHENYTISWHTVRDADVAHSGALTFIREKDGNTCVNFVVEYEPQKALSGEFPPRSQEKLDHIVQLVLNQFKGVIESQKTGIPGVMKSGPKGASRQNNLDEMTQGLERGREEISPTRLPDSI